MKRILMFSLVLALLGAMIISSAAFAGNGPGPGDCGDCQCDGECDCDPNAYDHNYLEPGPHGPVDRDGQFRVGQG